MPIGLTFGSEKDKLRMVVENGVAATDPRVKTRANEAIQELLGEIIPVNGMATYDVIVDSSGVLLLPKELENAIEVLPLGKARVNGRSDVVEGWYDLVNQYTYVDPSMAHDNPLVDLFLRPDPITPATLRRAYSFPGVDPGTRVRVTGAKRYVPIVLDTDSLIIQNVPAIKRMIQSIERLENNDPAGGAQYRQMALEILGAEVKKHQLDPRNMMRRKAVYQADLVTYRRGSMGWMRARIALEVPGAQMLGKLELTRLIERAEERLMESGLHKGCIEEFDAAVVCGHVVMPERVESVLAANICGEPIPVRSIFFKYLENGPGDWDCSCGGRLDDEGDIVMADGTRRRKYFVYGAPAALPTATAATIGGGTVESDTFGTLTADSYIYLGANARLVALPNGVSIEIRQDDGTWVEQGEWTE